MENQGDSPCSPTPTPTPSKNYRYEGAVIRLTHEDFAAWEKSYSNIPNLTAVLQNRDDWLAKRPESERKNWFMSTSNVLANKDAEFAKQAPADDPFTGGVVTDAW